MCNKFNKHVAGLAIELFNNSEVYSIVKAHLNGKATFEELTLAICQNACLFNIYRVSNMGNYSTRQLYKVIANAVLAGVKKPSGYYAHEAIFNYVKGLKIKPLHNVALYAIEAYFNRYKGATPAQLSELYELGKFTMLTRAIELCPLTNFVAFCERNNVHACPKCVTCYIFEQCQNLPTLKAVKKYLKQTGLFNGYTPVNEA